MGRRSPIMTRRVVAGDGKRPSRQGVSQRYTTEAQLVTEAMKVLKTHENMIELGFVKLPK